MSLTLRRLAQMAKEGELEVNEMAEGREGFDGRHYSRVWDILATIKYHLIYKAELEESYLCNLEAGSEPVEEKA